MCDVSHTPVRHVMYTCVTRHIHLYVMSCTYSMLHHIHTLRHVRNRTCHIHIISEGQTAARRPFTLMYTSIHYPKYCMGCFMYYANPQVYCILKTPVKVLPYIVCSRNIFVLPTIIIILQYSSTSMYVCI